MGEEGRRARSDLGAPGGKLVLRVATASGVVDGGEERSGVLGEVLLNLELDVVADHRHPIARQLLGLDPLTAAVGGIEMTPKERALEAAAAEPRIVEEEDEVAIGDDLVGKRILNALFALADLEAVAVEADTGGLAIFPLLLDDEVGGVEPEDHVAVAVGDQDVEDDFGNLDRVTKRRGRVLGQGRRSDEANQGEGGENGGEPGATATLRRRGRWLIRSWCHGLLLGFFSAECISGVSSARWPGNDDGVKRERWGIRELSYLLWITPPAANGQRSKIRTSLSQAFKADFGEAFGVWCPLRGTDRPLGVSRGQFPCLTPARTGGILPPLAPMVVWRSPPRESHSPPGAD